MRDIVRMDDERKINYRQETYVTRDALILINYWAKGAYLTNSSILNTQLHKHKS